MSSPSNNVSQQARPRADIASADDVTLLIERFYAKVLDDEIIGFFFTDVARIHLPEHLPKIAAFWRFQLLGDRSYKGNVFQAHKDLHDKAVLTQHHFHRWVYLFTQTVDELFSGPTADKAKQRAAAVAEKMHAALAAYGGESPCLAAQNAVMVFDPDA